MARILRQRTPGEPQPKSQQNSWGYRPGRNSKRPKLGMRTLRKANPADALGVAGVESQTISADGLQKVTAGTIVPGTRARGLAVLKRQKLTPKPAKGTKVIAPPSPTNKGGIRNPYGKRPI